MALSGAQLRFGTALGISHQNPHNIRPQTARTYDERQRVDARTAKILVVVFICHIQILDIYTP